MDCGRCWTVITSPGLSAPEPLILSFWCLHGTSLNIPVNGAPLSSPSLIPRILKKEREEEGLVAPGNGCLEPKDMEQRPGTNVLFPDCLCNHRQQQDHSEHRQQQDDSRRLPSEVSTWGCPLLCHCPQGSQLLSCDPGQARGCAELSHPLPLELP